MKHLLVSRLLARKTTLGFIAALAVMAIAALTSQSEAWTCTTQCYGNTCYTNCY
jgi:hypothetical protein